MSLRLRFPSLLLCLTLLGGCGSSDDKPGGDSGNGGDGEVTQTEVGVPLQGRDVKVTVQDHGAEAGAAQRIQETAKSALPLIELAAGFAYPRDHDVVIAVYAEKGDETGNEVGFLEVIEEGEGDDKTSVATVRVWQGIPDFLLVHELAHLWFAENFAKEHTAAGRWLIEGLANYTAVEVCRSNPSLGDPVELRHLLVEETFNKRPSGFDPVLTEWQPPFPLPATSSDEDTNKRLGFYGKAYCFFHIARAVGGEDCVRTANAAAADGGPVDTAAYLEKLLAASAALAGIDAGWTAAGSPASKFAYALLDDDDSDGLTNGEERGIYGTRPTNADTDGDGVDDGLEVLVFKTDPRDALSMPNRRLRADGDFGDWPSSATVTADDAGDGEGPTDLLEVRAFQDGKMLYLGIKTAGGFPESGAAWNVSIDEDLDGEPDVIVGFGEGLTPWVGRVYGDVANVSWHPNRLAPYAATADGAELFVPIAALGLERQVELKFYTTGGTGSEGNADEAEPIRVQLPLIVGSDR
jgi:hypothetical protein